MLHAIYTAQTIQAHLATLHQAQHHTQQQQQRNLSTSSLQQILLNQNFRSAGRGSGKSGKLVVIILFLKYNMEVSEWICHSGLFITSLLLALRFVGLYSARVDGCYGYKSATLLLEGK